MVFNPCVFNVSLELFTIVNYISFSMLASGKCNTFHGQEPCAKITTHKKSTIPEVLGDRQVKV